MNKTLRICDKGHKFYKSSSCNACPICDKLEKPKEGFLSKLNNPTRRALLGEKIDSLEKLASYSKKEILNLHGVGPKSIPIMIRLLEEVGLAFKEDL
ncbi:MAG: hypothetical protein WC006_09435 [Bacilli bacterium]|nr:hypothetical protein [Bacilli bacterium]